MWALFIRNIHLFASQQDPFRSSLSFRREVPCFDRSTLCQRFSSNLLKIKTQHSLFSAIINIPVKNVVSASRRSWSRGSPPLHCSLFQSLFLLSERSNKCTASARVHASVCVCWVTRLQVCSELQCGSLYHGHLQEAVKADPRLRFLICWATFWAIH